MLVGVVGAVATLVHLGTFHKEERPYGFGFIGLVLAWIGSVMVHTSAYVPSSFS